MLMNSRMMIGVGVALVALVAGVVIYLNYQKVDPNKGPVVAKGDIIYLNNDLTAKERQEFYHMAEGSELYPVLWMQALKTKEGKYFLDDVERLGFLADPDNEHGLPVGLTSGVTRGLEPLGPMSGLNCAACHVGELHYNGKRVRIDGAPNLLNTRAFFVTLIDSALDTAKDPGKLIAFIAKVHELEEKKDKKEPSKIRALARKVAVGLAQKEEEALNAVLMPLFDDLIKKEFESPRFSFKAALKDNVKDLEEFNKKLTKDLNLDEFADFVKHSTVLKGIVDEAEKQAAFKDVIHDFYIKLRLLRARAEFLKKLGMVGEDKDTEIWGPGRVDAFGSARAFLFQTGYRPLTPVSYPPIFELPTHDWFHYDNNTNTFLERNFGQALGVGAVWDSESKTYSLQPKNLRQLESLARKLTAPKWPEDVFGQIDQPRAKRGEQLYGTYCAKCHDAAKNDKFDKLGELAEIKTDPNRATTFAAKVPPTDTPFPDMIKNTLAEIKEVALAEFTPEEQEAIRKEPVKWLGPAKYSARTTKGSWSTAPYLHNGSVPTLYELLQPVSKRSEKFYIGSRQYDIEKLGYVSDEKMTLFDTSKPANSNAGHDGKEFGTHISEEERKDLLEYLKSQ
jgi:mono/diheme cytochrome c family protein